MAYKTKLPVSVLVQTKNEELSIERCINSLSGFSEVIVVDSHSEDRTVEIAIAAGAKVVLFEWNGEYPKKKQWQLENLSPINEWVLFLDADEYPSPGLMQEISQLDLSEEKRKAFDIEIDYWFSGRKLRHGHRVVKRILLHLGDAYFPDVGDQNLPGMGELEGHYQPVVLGPHGYLRNRLQHHDVDPVRWWFDRHNRYSDWEAALRSNRERRLAADASRSRQGRLFSRLPGKPIAFFLYCFFLRLGFLDGRAGLDYALALSFYYWQIDLKYREIRLGEMVDIN